MTRTSTSCTNHSKLYPHSDATRDFTRILKTLRPFWDPFEVDPEEHTARGVLSAKNGKAYTADLSVNDSRKRVWVTVRLRVSYALTPSRLRSLLDLQNGTMGLCFVSFDAEHRMLLLRSCSVLPTIDSAPLIVPQVVSDLLRLLEDDRLTHLLN